MATYCAAAKLKGSLTIGKTKMLPGETISAEEAWGLFTIKRAYFGYHTFSQMIFATGKADGKDIAFIIDAKNDMVPDPEIINQNLLIADGKITPLPPVKMTQPFGLNDKWIIQDTENMVDLTLEPQSNITRELKAFAFSIRVTSICGKFNGMLKDCEGNDIKLDGFSGIARDMMLRV